MEKSCDNGLKKILFEEDFNQKLINTAWKVSKYVVISGPYFPVFGLNTEIDEVNHETYAAIMIKHEADVEVLKNRIESIQFESRQ